MREDTAQYLNENFGYQIFKTNSIIKLAITKAFKSANSPITPEQWFVLYVVNQENGLYQKQIADILYKDKPNITRLLDILEEKGFIVRKNEVTNRRITKIYTTERGTRYS